MNINEISTQLLYTTVPIYAKNNNGSFSSGTGFIFSVMEQNDTSIPLLITNYHVLENAVAGFVELHIAEKGLPSEKSIRIQFNESIINGNKLGNLDLIAIPLASTLNELKQKGINIFYRTVDQNMLPKEEQIEYFAAIEDITFIGYPSGLYDSVNKLPIIRQGITATPIWNQFNGENVFLIDAGVFPGSSGSPVFIYNHGSYPTKDGIAIGNRLLFIGVISETMIRNEADAKSYLDLGKVIGSKVMYEEVTNFIQRINKV